MPCLVFQVTKEEVSSQHKPYSNIIKLENKFSGFEKTMEITETHCTSILTRASGYLKEVCSHSLNPYIGCGYESLPVAKDVTFASISGSIGDANGADLSM